MVFLCFVALKSISLQVSNILLNTIKCLAQVVLNSIKSIRNIWWVIKKGVTLHSLSGINDAPARRILMLRGLPGEDIEKIAIETKQ